MNPHPLSASACAAAPEPKTTSPISAAKLAANKENAQLSTGPASPEGKAKSSVSAIKTGLTGRTVLLPADDVAVYQEHVAEYERNLRPVGQRECDLVQSIADSSWRLERIPALELAIYARGRIQFANSFDDQDPALRSSLIELETHLTYEKQLRNLQLQESRLHRRREKDLAELRQAQSERRNRDTQTLEIASRLLIQAKRANKPFDPASLNQATPGAEPNAHGIGFEFSISDIEAYSDGRSVLDIAYAAFKRASASRAKVA